jgi:hypothetical protein
MRQTQTRTIGTNEKVMNISTRLAKIEEKLSLNNAGSGLCTKIKICTIIDLACTKIGLGCTKKANLAQKLSGYILIFTSICGFAQKKN